MNITTDVERAYRLFDTLLADWKSGKYPYNISLVPQRRENLPPDIWRDSTAHAIFLFCSCYYMAGGIQSETAFRSLSQLYSQNPDLFVPSLYTQEDRLSELALRIMGELKANRLSYHADQTSNFWAWNMHKLHKFWKGNPANLFADVGSYDELCYIVIGVGKRKLRERIGFWGFQHKMVSMLTYFLVDARIVKDFEHPVPVDFHVLRLLVAHGVLDRGQGVENEGVPLNLKDLQESARRLTVRYCMERRISALDLCNALWLFSNSMCNRHPGNKSIVGQRNGRSTPVAPKPYVWSERLENTYLQTCHVCPIKETCHYNVPSAPYYVRGKLEKRGVRSYPDQLFLKI